MRCSTFGSGSAFFTGSTFFTGSAFFSGLGSGFFCSMTMSGFTGSGSGARSTFTGAGGGGGGAGAGSTIGGSPPQSSAETGPAGSVFQRTTNAMARNSIVCAASEIMNAGPVPLSGACQR